MRVSLVFELVSLFSLNYRLTFSFYPRCSLHRGNLKSRSESRQRTTTEEL